MMPSGPTRLMNTCSPRTPPMSASVRFGPADHEVWTGRRPRDAARFVTSRFPFERQLFTIGPHAHREAVMALAAGVRFGPYEIVSLIGAGGMGEVYRARDTKLGRDVALKVLPDSLARDPGRLARFEREAHLLATVNHPHIAQIHGLEDSTGTPALVMELVEGPTLADRIAQGPIPIENALPIAKRSRKDSKRRTSGASFTAI